MILLILANCPLDPTLRQPTVEPNEDEAIGLLIEEEVEGEQDIRLQQYHHILDLATENMDGEDHYQQYCWKVKKILDQTKRGRQIFLKVLWKPGNVSWISLRSLRNHDLHSCVLYALEKARSVTHLGNRPKISSRITNHTKLSYALKMMKSFGPTYKLGIKVPRSVKHTLKKIQEMVAHYGEIL